MSSHGGPRHALDPNPRQHSLGERAEDRDAREQELRDQTDPLERARRLRDYHVRAGRCLYSPSDPADIRVAKSSSTAAAVPRTNVLEESQIVNLEAVQPNAVTTVFGDEHVAHFSPSILSAGIVLILGASPEQLSSITSSRTAGIVASSGTAATGNRFVQVVTPERPRVRTVGLVTFVDDERDR